MTSGIEWARDSAFNWTFDNCGGTPLQAVVAGLWNRATFPVYSDQIIIPEVLGGGKVYYLRGVWKTDALFAWGGFWVNPESGDTTNYYTGGSFRNSGNQTIVTLGTGLPDGTTVQAYYVYHTGGKASKYDALNSIPCMRPAWRSASDYTYDYAVDRIFDAMAAVYFAYREQGLDPSDILQFFWNEYYSYAESNTPPLVLDNFNRQWYDRGSYLMYVNSTLGMDGLTKFDPELPPDDKTYGRALRFMPSYYHGPGFSAWFGYGFNWDLTQRYFEDISKVRFKARGKGTVSRVQKFIKMAGSGTSDMVLVDGFNIATVRYYQVQVSEAGAPGTAKALLSVYGPDMQPLVVDTEILCPTSTAPVNLGHGLQAYWTDGTLAVGDTWQITCGNQEIRPHKLKVILNDSVPEDEDPFGEEHTFVHGIGDYYPSWQEFEIDFSQFWRLGNIIDCRDRKPGNWGNWSVHNMEVGTPWEMLFYDVHSPETIDGKVFYTKQRFTWNMDPGTIVSLGYFVGIPSGVDSTGATEINYLIRHYLADSIAFRTKVRDANGNYFYHDDVINPNEWVRVSIDLSSFLPESGGILTHPLTLVEVGIPSNPPAQGSFDLIDLKFGEHLPFTGSQNLRVVEFKYLETGIKTVQGPDWYFDDFGFDLSVEDPYPYCPRLAISLNAYGRNPWRGPTLVHYSHPLAPFLVNRFDIKNTMLALHTDAQAEFYNRYGGVKGPIMPVHSRNDLENVELCGEENFNRFCWWSKYRDHGKETASWRFNTTMLDALGTHTFAMTSGSPVWGTGICQPGNTSLLFDGTSKHAFTDGTDFNLTGDFTIEAVVKVNTASPSCTLVCKWNQTGNQRSWHFYLSSGYLSFGWSTDGADYPTVNSSLRITDTNWHYVAITREGNTLTLYLDGRAWSVNHTATYFPATAPLRIGSTQGTWPGYLNGAIDYVSVHKGRAMSQGEIQGRWQVIQGLQNGSNYPEVGHCLGQFWAFHRLGEHYFVSNDLGAWDILDNWLDWLQTMVVSDGAGGYKFPIWFHEYGYNYDTDNYDAGGAASVVIGCLYIYMRNGDTRALDLAQKLLMDLRINRPSGDYGGYLYKSDYHYAWMNALVAHAFGMAIVGRAGAAHRYPYTSDDETHYQNMMANFWAMSGDTKPNLLNSDCIPYHDAEPHDIWDYAPHYLFMKEMGSMEGVVLMMHAAIDWALYDGNWYWFQTLLEFMVRLSGLTLTEQQIYSLGLSYLTTSVANRVNVTYGNFKQDNSRYVEQTDQGMIDLLGEKRLSIAMHYGSAVITEDKNTAEKIAQRALEYFSVPKETVKVIAGLSAARADANDVVRVQSSFHGLQNDAFRVVRKSYDQRKLRVELELMRSVQYLPSWAVDLAGTVHDSFAINLNSDHDPDWGQRSHAN